MLTNALGVVATVPAHDLGRARTFYETTLGLSPDDMMPPDDGGVLYSINNQSFMVYLTEATRGSTTVASFLVKDLAAEILELKARGVLFEDYDLPGLKTVNHVMDAPRMKVAWFKDSEGNILGLNQRK